MHLYSAFRSGGTCGSTGRLNEVEKVGFQWRLKVTIFSQSVVISRRYFENWDGPLDNHWELQLRWSPRQPLGTPIEMVPWTTTGNSNWDGPLDNHWELQFSNAEKVQNLRKITPYCQKADYGAVRLMMTQPNSEYVFVQIHW